MKFNHINVTTDNLSISVVATSKMGIHTLEVLDTSLNSFRTVHLKGAVMGTPAEYKHYDSEILAGLKSRELELFPEVSKVATRRAADTEDVLPLGVLYGVDWFVDVGALREKLGVTAWRNVRIWADSVAPIKASYALGWNGTRFSEIKATFELEQQRPDLYDAALCALDEHAKVHEYGISYEDETVIENPVPPKELDTHAGELPGGWDLYCVRYRARKTGTDKYVLRVISKEPRVHRANYMITASIAPETDYEKDIRGLLKGDIIFFEQDHPECLRPLLERILNVLRDTDFPVNYWGYKRGTEPTAPDYPLVAQTITGAGADVIVWKLYINDGEPSKEKKSTDIKLTAESDKELPKANYWLRWAKTDDRIGINPHTRILKQHHPDVHKWAEEIIRSYKKNS